MLVSTKVVYTLVYRIKNVFEFSNLRSEFFLPFLYAGDCNKGSNSIIESIINLSGRYNYFSFTCIVSISPIPPNNNLLCTELHHETTLLGILFRPPAPYFFHHTLYNLVKIVHLSYNPFCERTQRSFSLYFM